LGRIQRRLLGRIQRRLLGDIHTLELFNFCSHVMLTNRLLIYVNIKINK